MSGPLVETHMVTPEYFRAMGIPLLKGRLLTPADAQHAMEMDGRRREAYEKRPAPNATSWYTRR
jgi:hypothetical protein